jgi:hypothetical protein
MFDTAAGGGWSSGTTGIVNSPALTVPLSSRFTLVISMIEQHPS